MTETAARQETAGRHAAYLFWISGALTIVNNYLPDSAYLNRTILNAVGFGAIMFGGISLAVPWRRFPERATLVIAPAAFGLIVAGNAFGSVSAYSYAVYYVVAFAWVGIHHPPGTAFKLAPLAIAAYVAPPVLGSVREVASISSVTVAIPVCLLVAETIARTSRTMQRLQSELEDLSYEDALTGIGNRRKAQQMLENAREGQAVVIVDVDHFKRINDEHGHPYGDMVLARLAKFLKDNIRTGDIVARYGGEEFLIVLRECSLEGAEAVASRLRELWVQSDAPATFSAGVALFRGSEGHATTLKRADDALYAAKDAGRNRVVVAA